MIVFPPEGVHIFVFNNTINIDNQLAFPIGTQWGVFNDFYFFLKKYKLLKFN
jgi:hypothetical protein